MLSRVKVLKHSHSSFDCTLQASASAVDIVSYAVLDGLEAVNLPVGRAESSLKVARNNAVGRAGRPALSLCGSLLQTAKALTGAISGAEPTAKVASGETIGGTL
jgi:hypothetical protein